MDRHYREVEFKITNTYSWWKALDPNRELQLWLLKNLFRSDFRYN